MPSFQCGEDPDCPDHTIYRACTREGYMICPTHLKKRAKEPATWDDLPDDSLTYCEYKADGPKRHTTHLVEVMYVKNNGGRECHATGDKDPERSIITWLGGANDAYMAAKAKQSDHQNDDATGVGPSQSGLGFDGVQTSRMPQNTPSWGSEGGQSLPDTRPHTGPLSYASEGQLPSVYSNMSQPPPSAADRLPGLTHVLEGVDPRNWRASGSSMSEEEFEKARLAQESWDALHRH